MAKKSNKDKSSSSSGEDHVIVEHHHVDEMHHRMAIAGAAILFVAVLLFFTSSVGKPDTLSVDQFMYIEHETCQSCVNLQSVAREAADALGVPFTAVTYNRDVPYPGYILVYKDIVHISGFQAETEFWAALCSQTAHEQICDRAANQKAIDEQTVQ